MSHHALLLQHGVGGVDLPGFFLGELFDFFAKHADSVRVVFGNFLFVCCFDVYRYGIGSQAEN